MISRCGMPGEAAPEAGGPPRAEYAPADVSPFRLPSRLRYRSHAMARPAARSVLS